MFGPKNAKCGKVAFGGWVWSCVIDILSSRKLLLRADAASRLYVLGSDGTDEQLREVIDMFGVQARLVSVRDGFRDIFGTQEQRSRIVTPIESTLNLGLRRSCHNFICSRWCWLDSMCDRLNLPLLC
eukprot:2980372-Amphidinium_carterae.1